MTELIQGEKELPKNIRQIGAPDIGDRIYIENQAYQTMHPQGIAREKMVYVLPVHFYQGGDSIGGNCV